MANTPSIIPDPYRDNEAKVMNFADHIREKAAIEKKTVIQAAEKEIHRFQDIMFGVNTQYGGAQLRLRDRNGKVITKLKPGAQLKIMGDFAQSMDDDRNKGNPDEHIWVQVEVDATDTEAGGTGKIKGWVSTEYIKSLSDPVESEIIEQPILDPVLDNPNVWGEEEGPKKPTQVPSIGEKEEGPKKPTQVPSIGEKEEGPKKPTQVPSIVQAKKIETTGEAPLAPAAPTGTVTQTPPTIPAAPENPNTPTVIPTERAPEIKSSTYVIQEGDTLGKIADKFNVSKNDLMAENDLWPGHPIYIGESLVIPTPREPETTGKVADASKTEKTDIKEAEKTEKPGDSLTGASTWGSLFKKWFGSWGAKTPTVETTEPKKDTILIEKPTTQTAPTDGMENVVSNPIE